MLLDRREGLVLLLGDPNTCPHGNPIPGTKRALPERATVRLADSEPGQVTIARISEKLELDDAGLNLVATARLTPGSTATVVVRDVAGVHVRTPTGEHTIPPIVAEQMFITS